jgi:endonuclease YncB( thermonuclease family)
LTLIAAPLRAQTLAGKVIAVGDGDTVTIMDTAGARHRVRLVGVDAPERRQSYGATARAALAARVLQRQVVIEGVGRDRYRRLLGRVLCGGSDVNLEMVRAGLAWFYRAYGRSLSPADRERYALAEAEARAARRGLWAQPSPTPPWVYRHSRRAGERAR